MESGKFTIRKIDEDVIYSPKKNDVILQGEPLFVRWNNEKLSGSYVTIKINCDNSRNYNIIRTTLNNGEYITNSHFNIMSSNCVVTIEELDDNLKCVNEFNSEVFSISPEFEVYSPRKGEILKAGKLTVINWDTVSINSNHAIIELSVDNGKNWDKIDVVNNDGIYKWIVPGNINSRDCIIRITSEENIFLDKDYVKSLNDLGY